MLDLGEDIISSLVVRTLPIGVLLNLLMTCKQLYTLRKHCIANNDTCKRYKRALKAGLLGKMLNSHIDLQTYALQTNISCSDFQIYHNTFSVLYSTDTFGDIHTIQRYCTNMLKSLYGYDIKRNCENNILDHHFCKDGWQHSNVPVFVYYEIVYHIANQKYRNLEYTLINHVKFLPAKKHKFATLEMLMSFIMYQNNTLINAAMIYVIYEYILFMLDDLLSTASQNFIYYVIHKKREFHNDVMRMKRLPKYIKRVILNKLSQVVSIIEEKTKTL